jgi:hypothetical protein
MPLTVCASERRRPRRGRRRRWSSTALVPFRSNSETSVGPVFRNGWQSGTRARWPGGAVVCGVLQARVRRRLAHGAGEPRLHVRAGARRRAPASPLVARRRAISARRTLPCFGCSTCISSGRGSGGSIVAQNVATPVSRSAQRQRQSRCSSSNPSEIFGAATLVLPLVVPLASPQVGRWHRPDADLCSVGKRGVCSWRPRRVPRLVRTSSAVAPAPSLRSSCGSDSRQSGRGGAGGCVIGTTRV